MTHLLLKPTCEWDSTPVTTPTPHPGEGSTWSFQVPFWPISAFLRCLGKRKGRNEPSLTSDVDNSDLNPGVRSPWHLLRNAPGLLHHFLMLCHCGWLRGWNSALAKVQGIWGRGQVNRAPVQFSPANICGGPTVLRAAGPFILAGLALWKQSSYHKFFKYIWPQIYFSGFYKWQNVKRNAFMSFPVLYHLKKTTKPTKLVCLDE